MNEPRKLSSYVEPELTQARIDAQWSRIGERLPAPKRAPRWQLATGAGLGLTVIAVVMWLQSEPARDSAWEGSVVRSEQAPVEMTLAEGSRVELSPRSQVELLHSVNGSVQLRLNEGSARFSVSKHATRRFSVRSGPVEVVVTDTQFRITRVAEASGEHVRIDVEAGSAEVRRRDGEAIAIRLIQGEHWSTFVAYEKTTPVADEVVRMRPAPTAEESPAAQADVIDEAQPPESTLDEPTERRSPRGHSQSAQAAQEAHAQEAQANPADELFARANIARRAGQVREAEALYAAMVQRFPRDDSAALAAFELGRIRMDALSDLRGAVQAFDRALALDGRRAFAEDALARLALAHDGLGDTANCKRAKERYLSRYPEGVHANILSRRCP